MMKWGAYAFVRITLAMALGIVCYVAFPLEVNPCYFSVPAGLFLLLQFGLTQTFHRVYPWLAGAAAMLTLFTFGYLLAGMHAQAKQPGHYMHQLHEVEAFRVTVTGEAQRKPLRWKVPVAVTAVKTPRGWEKSWGQLLLYLADTSLAVQYGMEITLLGVPSPPQPPTNPHQFHYARYLENQQVYAVHFAKSGTWQVENPGHPSGIMSLAMQLRAYSRGVLNQYLTDDLASGIALALILGIKDQLDTTIRDAFADTGAMHVLAVSGLHVGIIFMILSTCLVFLEKKAWGRVLSAALTLAVLWLYAMVTGFSPSVLRAVTMFSCVIAGGVFRRKGNIYNTLLFSAFVLLCSDPYLLFQVGFQLSYAAVLGIVSIQPALYQLWKAPNRPLDYAWGLTCVSVAAQIGTFPLGMLYFHQFPVYFILTNLVVIPGAFVVLCLGLLLLLVSGFPLLAAGVGQLLTWAIQVIGSFIFSLQSVPGAVWEGITLTGWQTVWLYAVLLMLWLAFRYRTLWAYAALACCMGACTFTEALEQADTSRQGLLTVYDTGKGFLWSLVEGPHAWVLGDSALVNDGQLASFTLQSHFIALHAEKAAPGLALPFRQCQGPGYQVFLWRGRTILQIEQALGQLLPFSPDLVLVRDLADLAVVQGLEKAQVIVCGPRKVGRQVKNRFNAEINGISVHSTKEKGAFLWRLQ